MSGNNNNSDDNKEKGDDPLKESLRSAVQTTNRALASLESTIKGPITTAYHKTTETGSEIAAYGVDCYQRRHEFGVVGIAATSLTAGGIVTLRRGRLPGVVAAAIAGAAAYGVVYGLDDLNLPERFGGSKREDE